MKARRNLKMRQKRRRKQAYKHFTKNKQFLKVIWDDIPCQQKDQILMVKDEQILNHLAQQIMSYFSNSDDMPTRDLLLIQDCGPIISLTLNPKSQSMQNAQNDKTSKKMPAVPFEVRFAKSDETQNLDQTTILDARADADLVKKWVSNIGDLDDPSGDFHSDDDDKSRLSEFEVFKKRIVKFVGDQKNGDNTKSGQGDVSHRQIIRSFQALSSVMMRRVKSQILKHHQMQINSTIPSNPQKTKLMKPTTTLSPLDPQKSSILDQLTTQPCDLHTPSPTHSDQQSDELSFIKDFTPQTVSARKNSGQIEVFDLQIASDSFSNESDLQHSPPTPTKNRDIHVRSLFKKLKKRGEAERAKSTFADPRSQYLQMSAKINKLLLDQSYQSTQSTEKSEHPSGSKSQQNPSQIPPGLNIPSFENFEGFLDADDVRGISNEHQNGGGYYHYDENGMMGEQFQIQEQQHQQPSPLQNFQTMMMPQQTAFGSQQLYPTNAQPNQMMQHFLQFQQANQPQQQPQPPINFMAQQQPQFQNAHPTQQQRFPPHQQQNWSNPTQIPMQQCHYSNVQQVNNFYIMMSPQQMQQQMQASGFNTQWPGPTMMGNQGQQLSFQFQKDMSYHYQCQQATPIAEQKNQVFDWITKDIPPRLKGIYFKHHEEHQKNKKEKLGKLLFQ